jgi:hypothetical protein
MATPHRIQAADQDIDQAGVPIADAAAALGVSVDAVRKRIRRRSLRAYKRDGHWLVVLPGRPAHVRDASSPRVQVNILDEAQDNGQDRGRPPVQDAAYGELVATLRDEVTFLRRELDTRTEELRRKDHIIAALAQRVPELTARTAPATSSPPSSADPDAAMAVQRRRRWWWPW